MADTPLVAAPNADEKGQQLPPNTPINDNDVEPTQSSKPRTTGPILLAVCAAILLIMGSCYIVFSAAQSPRKLEDALDADCYALLESNERLRQQGFRNLTYPSPDCYNQIRSFLRSEATKTPPPREIRKHLMVRTPMLERALFASLVVTLVLDLACTWGGLGGRYAILDALKKWSIRLLPPFYLVAAAVPLYRNDYTVPSARLPAALLVGVSARVLVDILYRQFPRYKNYVGTGYVAAGVYAMSQSPVAGADEMDLAFALTFVLGGYVANRLIGSVSPKETEGEGEKEVEGEKEKVKEAVA